MHLQELAPSPHALSGDALDIVPQPSGNLQPDRLLQQLHPN
jgi:hypothetical protein